MDFARTEIGKACELMGRMEREGVMPNVVTLNSWFLECVGMGRLAALLIFFDRRTLGLVREAMRLLHSNVIGGFLHAKNVGRAMELYDEMLREGQSLDPILYFTLFS